MFFESRRQDQKHTLSLIRLGPGELLGGDIWVSEQRIVGRQLYLL